MLTTNSLLCTSFFVRRVTSAHGTRDHTKDMMKREGNLPNMTVTHLPSDNEVGDEDDTLMPMGHSVGQPRNQPLFSLRKMGIPTMTMKRGNFMVCRTHLSYHPVI